MGLQQELGRQVRLHRERSGLSQVDLAEAIGRSVQMLGRIERGRSAPSLDTLEEIARVLQTPVRDLFGSGPAEEGVGRIVQRLSGLSPDEIDWIDHVVAAALGRPRGR
jgi:transcriptional regulator with XRE-family HTH domain